MKKLYYLLIFVAFSYLGCSNSTNPDDGINLDQEIETETHFYFEGEELVENGEYPVDSVLYFSIKTKNPHESIVFFS